MLLLSLPMAVNVALDKTSPPVPFPLPLPLPVPLPFPLPVPVLVLAPLGRIGDGDLEPVSLTDAVAVEELVACGPPPPLGTMDLEPLLGPLALFCFTSNHSSSISELLTPTPSSLLLSNTFFLSTILLPLPLPFPLDTLFFMELTSAGSVGRLIDLFCQIEFFLVSFITDFCDVEVEVDDEVAELVVLIVVVRGGLREKSLSLL